jgi:hypothetical protein
VRQRARRRGRVDRHGGRAFDQRDEATDVGGRDDPRVEYAVAVERDAVQRGRTDVDPDDISHGRFGRTARAVVRRGNRSVTTKIAVSREFSRRLGSSGHVLRP